MAVDPTVVIDVAVAAGAAVAGNEKINKFLCGTYADGTARSLPDAINGEIYSPEQKAKAYKKKKKKKKNKSVKFKL